MKKIVILTYTNSDNYGTVLQAVATYNLFKETFKDYQVILANTDNRKNATRRLLSVCKPRNPKDMYLRISNFLGMRRYVKKNTNLSKKIYVNDYESAVKALKKMDMDALVVGSDEVWKSVSDRTPDLYLLPPELDVYKASYATSANRIDYAKLSEDDKEWITKALMSYKRICIRDTNSKDFVEKFIGDKKEILQVIDPTLCYHYEKEELSASLKKVFSSGRPKVVIMIKNKKLAKAIHNAVKDRYDVYSIYTLCDGIQLLKVKPEEFISVFGQADCVVTEFFHGTCFSIKSNAKFISVDTEAIYKTYESKIINVLSKLNLLEERYVDLTDSLTGENFDRLIAKIDENVNSKEHPYFDDAVAELAKTNLEYIETLKKDLEK